MEHHFNIIFVIILAIGLTTLNGDNVRLPDQIPNHQQINQILPQQQEYNGGGGGGIGEERSQREGKHLLDFVGLGTGNNIDPYLAKINSNCLSGDLAECFKSQALGTFNDFFSKDSYLLSANARIIRIPEPQFRSLEQEPYEYVGQSRGDDSEWDQLLKFAMRKIEKFIKSASFEIHVPNELSEGGRYSPRFITDEIADELDVIEDKKASTFNRHKLKKLIIPMLIILKLFKLKLLLFLPLILGLASFKKFLGFLAIIVPGVIGYFKFCKPQSGGGIFNGFSQYSPQGVGSASYHQHAHYDHEHQNGFSKPYGNYYYRDNSYSQYGNGNEHLDAAGSASGGSNIRFGGDEATAQNLAYQGYSQYRNKNVDNL